MARFDRKRFWERNPKQQVEPKWWGVVRELRHRRVKSLNRLTWDFEVEDVVVYVARPYHLYATHYIDQQMSREEAEAMCKLLNAGNENGHGE